MFFFFYTWGISILAAAVSLLFCYRNYWQERARVSDLSHQYPQMLTLCLLFLAPPLCPPSTSLSERPLTGQTEASPAGGGRLVGCQTGTCWAPQKEKGLSPPTPRHFRATDWNSYFLPEERPCLLWAVGRTGPQAERISRGQDACPPGA